MAQHQLLGVAEIAELLGVTRQAASHWRERHADFPSPIASLRSGPVWELPAILSWAQDHGLAIKSSIPETTGSAQHAAQDCVITAFVNMKGGVGKSTLTANLGWYCAYKTNYRVLLVDLDPQFNLSQYVLGTDGYEEHLDQKKPTVVDVFEQHSLTRSLDTESAPTITVVHEWDDGSLLHLLPSQLELAWTLKYPQQKEHLLRDYFDELRHNYDLILIDCPPTESVLTAAAYLASDYLIVPVRPEFLSTIGLPLLVRSLDDHRKQYKKEPHPTLAGIIFNDFAGEKNEHIKSRTFVEEVAEAQEWHIFGTHISHSDSYPAGARVGRPIFLTDHARTTKKAELEAVAQEFIQRVGLSPEAPVA